jgi:Fe-Mn family superoxide dismutase
MMSLSRTAVAAARTTRVAAGIATATTRTKYSLPDLPYDYNALEPVISAEIMELHHSKHHQTYVTNLNAATEQYEEAVHNGDLSKQIALQGAIRFNGGGHINHDIFWTNLAPQSQGGGDDPTGELMTKIEQTFGSFEDFKTKFSAQTAAVQGSGWGWLGYNQAKDSLEIVTMPNQDPLKGSTGLEPLLGVDVWEHAYYLQYKNVRPDYLKAIWEVVNWNNVNERFVKAKGQA